MFMRSTSSPLSFAALFLGAAFTMVSFPALAQVSTGSLLYPLCIIYLTLTGDVGRVMASIAIMTLGVAALYGRVTWTQALIIATGIATVFSAGQIAGVITGRGSAYVDAVCVGAPQFR